MNTDGKKNRVIELYNEGKTNIEIGHITGLAASTIRWAINSSGLKSHRRALIAYDPVIEQFILGSMLGDGHIDKYDRLSFGHSERQKEYIAFKESLLNKCGLTTYISSYEVKNKRYENSYKVFTLRTKANNITANLRKLYYKEGIKLLPDEEYIKQFLTPFALAIWFMDDGNAASHNNLQFNTMSFSKGEINSLRYILLEKYGIKTTINSSKVITIRSSSYSWFISLIDSYVIPSMKYKYKLKVLDKSEELQEPPEVDNLQPSSSNDIVVDEKVQRLMGEESTNNPNTSIGQLDNS